MSEYKNRFLGHKSYKIDAKAEFSFLPICVPIWDRSLLHLVDSENVLLSIR